MNQAVIGVGSNIEPEKHIQSAREHIAKQHTILSESKFIKTKPIGYTNQPDFLNGVFLIETEMNKEDLTKWLHDLEDNLGRVRTENKFGPRTIDLDIVVWNGEIVDEDVYKREYLRKNISEILPELETNRRDAQFGRLSKHRSNNRFNNKYRIESTRLKGYDYSQPGAYFITICTKNREHYFSNVNNGKIVLSEIGLIANKYWHEIPNHFPLIECDAFVVMPNHVHGIINIVETPKLGVSIKTNQKTKPTLGVIINQYKRICTINIRKRDYDFAWQSRFYDHIIRNENELNRIREYIVTNPINWEKDDNYINSTNPNPTS